MARQVVFGAKGSTAFILERALAANLRRARYEVGSDGVAQVFPPRGLTGGQTEIMKGLVLFTCLQVGVAPPPAKRLPAGVPGPPPVHALARFEGLQIGAEYLEFVAGDLILIREPPPGIDAAGWAYGFLPRTGRCLFCSARARGVRARPQRSGQEEMTATRGHWLVSADVRALKLD